MNLNTTRCALTAAFAGLALALGMSQAHADPCTAPVRGFKAGDRLTGLIWYAVDGDGLCISNSPSPTTWIEIRESDFMAPELNEPGGRKAKVVMDRLVGRRAVCTVRRGFNGRVVSYDRVVAACRVDGRSIGEIMAGAGVAQGGRGMAR
jgi:endonuclease YncB( thermonuclease family)